MISRSSRLCCLLATLWVGALAASESPTGLWIVTLESPPLVEFAGFATGSGAEKAALAPTAPHLTGATRLDLDSAASEAYLDFLDREHSQVIAQASLRLGRMVQPVHKYTLVASGFSAAMTAVEAKALESLPGVLSVTPDALQELHSEAGSEWIGALDVWQGNVPGVAGNRGEGVVIGVIDTGIDWWHNAFLASANDGYIHVNPRGRFYGVCSQSAFANRCNSKLIGIWDFTDEAAEDGKDLDGHGSHVASTAAGNAFGGAIGGAFLTAVGVAPRANLISYKACKDIEGESRCPSSSLLQALDQAIADQVDVINYSIGGSLRDPWQGLNSGPNNDHRAFFNVRAAGIVAVTSAGNSGPAAGTITSPANAPWVISVANSSHNRRLETQLQELSGGATAPPQNIAGVSLSSGMGVVPIVWAGDYGFPLCSVGSDIDFPPSGASNPWAGQRPFNGQIVVCMRGGQARVAKSFNVSAAGGGGLILLNDLIDGASIVADEHVIPTTHLTYLDGQKVLQWVQSGSDHRGRISATLSVFDDSRGDRLAGSSSRGPVRPTGGFMKPDISAPGTDIIAAARFSGQPAILSGTSMASPHVAGAAALLLSAHPSWSVDRVESALMTSAMREQMQLPGGTGPATGNDVGAGRVRVDRAIKAGLFFPLSNAEYAAANSQSIASLQAINRPSVFSERCLQRCTFVRRVQPMSSAGSWNVSFRSDLPVAITVTPSSFSLSPGQTQTLSIDVDVSDPELAGAWVDAEIVLTASGSAAGLSPTLLPVTVRADSGSLPAAIDVDLQRNRGHVDIELADLVEIAPLAVHARGLTRGSQTSGQRAQDSAPSNPFRDNANGRLLQYVDVPAGIAMMLVEGSSPTAQALHVYAGRDDDPDGNLLLRQLRCSGVLMQSRQSCVVDAPAAGRYWLIAQNRVGSNSGNDLLRIDWALFENDADTTLIATAAGRALPDFSLPLRLSWDEGQMRSGQTWYGLLDVGPDAARAGQSGRIPVRLFRNGLHPEHGTQMLLPGDTTRIILAPGQAHERLFVDVSSIEGGNIMESLTVSASASSPSVRLFVASGAIGPGSPEVPAAPPRAQAAFSTAAAAAVSELTFPVPEGLSRWMITPENSAASEVTVEISLKANFSGVLTPAPSGPSLRAGDYYNPQRSGHGFNLSRAGDQWLLVWYHYIADGSPVWYIAQNLATSEGVTQSWTAPLLRFVWNGQQALATEVGRVHLIAQDEDSLLFSWELDGETGTEPFSLLGDRSCAQQSGQGRALSGHWYAPSLPGYGWTPQVTGTFEGHWLYVYDQQWQPRWVYAESEGPATQASWPLLQFKGFCPKCGTVATSSQSAGVMRRDYQGDQAADLDLAVDFAAPVPGGWTQQRGVVPLSVPRDCE